MHEILVNRLGGLSLPRKSVVRLTDRPDMTLDVYRGRKTTIQQQEKSFKQLLLLNRCTDFEIISQKRSLANPLPKLLKWFRSLTKWPPGL